jgi:hypothetical protein
VDVDYFNVFFFFQMFAQFGNINIHTPGIEVIVVDPNGFQGKIPFKDFVGIYAK